MKRIRLDAILGGCALATLAGCGRVVNWHTNTFYQGCPVDQFVEVPRSYIRSLYLYDQFSTIGLFDVLWLSDAVRTAYVSAYALKTGKGPEFRNNFLRRQLEENKHFITFYILSATSHLDEKEAAWSFYLCIKDKMYTPLEVKPIDLNQEYLTFFGKKYNSFKFVYEVKFSAVNTEEKIILDSTVAEMSLHVRSLVKEGVLTWCIPQRIKS